MQAGQRRPFSQKFKFESKTKQKKMDLAMKKILNSSPADRHLHEFPGLVGALRGDSAKMQAHYAALGKRNKHYASMAEGAASPGVLRHWRSWAAGAIRESRNA